MANRFKIDDLKPKVIQALVSTLRWMTILTLLLLSFAMEIPTPFL